LCHPRIATIGDNLRRVREKQKITRQEVTDFIGVDINAYERWEKGEADILHDIPPVSFIGRKQKAESAKGKCRKRSGSKRPFCFLLFSFIRVFVAKNPYLYPSKLGINSLFHFTHSLYLCALKFFIENR